MGESSKSMAHRPESPTNRPKKARKSRAKPNPNVRGGKANEGEKVKIHRANQSWFAPRLSNSDPQDVLSREGRNRCWSTRQRCIKVL